MGRRGPAGHFPRALREWQRAHLSRRRRPRVRMSSRNHGARMSRVLLIDVRLTKKMIYKKITSGVAGEPGSISRATNGFTRNAVSASKGDPLSSKSIRSKEKGANHFAPLGQ